MMKQENREIVIREGSIAEVLSLSLAIPEFEQPYGGEVYAERLKGRRYLVLVAVSGGKLVGFKVGYALDEVVFYSWMGGVLPAFRRKGIGNMLAHVQEEWAKQSGFSKMRLKTRNRHVAMIYFGLKRGFAVSDVIEKEHLEENRVVMEKMLG